MLLLWVIFLLLELQVFVQMLQSVSRSRNVLCFTYCLNIVLPLSYSVLWRQVEINTYLFIYPYWNTLFVTFRQCDAALQSSCNTLAGPITLMCEQCPHSDSNVCAIYQHGRSINLANTTELVLPSAHLSPRPKRQIDRFSRFAQITVESPILYNGRRFPAKLAPSHGRMWTPISVMIPWASLGRQ